MFSGAPGICHFYIVTGLAAAGVDTALPAFLLVTVPKYTKITVHLLPVRLLRFALHSRRN